ncbi:MAG: CsbD family protein [Nitrososphaeria archaeon]
MVLSTYRLISLNFVGVNCRLIFNEPVLAISFTSLTKGFINPKVYSKIMSKEEVKGKGKQIKGKIREEVGKLTDNKTEQLKGKIEKADCPIALSMLRIF